MGNEQGTGYVVLDLRLSETENDFKELRKELREHINKNDDEHKELRAGIAESNLNAREINIKMSQMVINSEAMKTTFKEATDEIKADVKSLGDKNGKENVLRAVLQDVVKIILMILGFIVTGKFFL